MTPPMEQRRVLPGIPEVSAVLDANAAATGRDRQVYEDYLLADPRPGQSWEDAVYGRMRSLAAGPPSEELKAEARRMVAHQDQARAA